MGYTNGIYGDEKGDFLEARAESVAVWVYNGHGLCEYGTKVRLICNDFAWAPYQYWLWVRARDIDDKDASQMLLAFANACNSLHA